MSQVRPYLQLIRVPNLFTAMADIMAGAWVAAGLAGSSPFSSQLIALIVSSTCLYAMGVVLNDYFDRHLDKMERPERPIPSGRISPAAALGLGIALGTAGVVAAAVVGMTSLALAVLTVACILLYDRYAKHHPVYGPITMGICRGLNLLLGMSLVPEQLLAYWWLSVFGVLYISAVTLMARGEVGPGSYPIRVRFVAAVIALCSIGVLLISTSAYQAVTLLAVVIFLIWTFSGVGPALKESTAPNIRGAVGKCIVALPLLDAAIAAPFGGWLAFASVVIFLVCSFSLAKLFAVT
ncbi:UbiA-like protein EboC [Paenibacillus xerothermodurans]|uniref:Ubiquinone biosynthesis protein UbiA n=1 Tax=Paenibacillus xerothermodurans TaxID=1977292 RepID=A0A2W1N843_PAEXE|nr:UbiA-like protein EboC [Paenibacillus xerothermodurans]PZE20014.1 ubiquinone biosynthesis protein UbiA [Paenibacillus xerothermodurans]